MITKQISAMFAEGTVNSAHVAIALLALIGAVMVAAIIRYKVDGVIKVWALIGALVGVVTGYFGTYFFTHEDKSKLEQQLTYSTYQREQIIGEVAAVNPALANQISLHANIPSENNSQIATGGAPLGAVYRAQQVPTSVALAGDGIRTVTNTVMVSVQAPNSMYAVSPAAATIIASKQSVSSLLPSSYATAGTGIFTSISGLLGLFIHMKSRKLKSAQTLADLVVPMISGVEAANHSTTKQAIQSAAVAAGVQQDLHQMVQAVTSQMPPAPAPKP